MFFLFFDIIVLISFLLGVTFMVFGNVSPETIMLLMAMPSGVGAADAFINVFMRK